LARRRSAQFEKKRNERRTLRSNEAVKELAQLPNEMQRMGVIRDYARFGATAQMRYTEPVATLYADVLVAVASADRLDVLGGRYEFCAAKGYRPEGEAIRVGAWPTQFIPAFSPLTEEAMKQAETADFEGVALRVVRADYLAVIAGTGSVLKVNS
jgi:hypothetical protein